MQRVGCPICGNSILESAGHCTKCGKAVLLTETTQRLKKREASVTEVLDPKTLEQNETPQKLVETPLATESARITAQRDSTAQKTNKAEAAPKATRKVAGRQHKARVQERIEVGSTLKLPRDAIQQGKRNPQEPAEAETTIKLPPRVAQKRRNQREPAEADMTIKLPPKNARQQSETPQEPAETELTLRLPPKAGQQRGQGPREVAESTLNRGLLRKGARESLENDFLVPFDETAQEDPDDDLVEWHGTWQKVVEHKTGPTLAVAPTASQIRGRRKFYWPVYVLKKGSPRTFFWLSSVVLVTLLLSGAFGMAISFGRNAHKTTPTQLPVLQVSPATIALGGIVTLRGVNFTHKGKIELSRDNHILLMDTGGMNAAQADTHGIFSDTIVVDPAWLSGPHTLYATDMRTHQQARFKIMVTGQNALEGPPHLLLSSNTLDLGSGDETTNASKLFALSNAGGGQVTWEASASQPWLQISPKSGSILSGGHMSAIVATDRSRLAPGSYQASIVFTSNTSQVTLEVSIKVTPLQPRHEAVLQLSPATMAFSGSARSADPAVQMITVSNPGIQPLIWGASVSMQNGSGWLWATPQVGMIQPGEQEQISVGTIIQNLAPGVYKGTITFSNQGSHPIQGSPQTIYVSLTVTPACTLTFSSSSLSFTGAHGGASPAGKSLKIGVAQSCTTNQSWTATATTSSGGGWLAVSPSRGVTPGTPLVSVSTAGLLPGTYNGTLTFTTAIGSQMVPVKLTVTPIPCTVSGPNSLTPQGTAGQSNVIVQGVTIDANGDCQHSLNWTSSVSGGSWLSVAPSGTLAPSSSANVSVQSNLAALSAGTYGATITITVVDSKTDLTVGTIRIPVTLTAQLPCTLQGPSVSALNFTSSTGADPATPTASFTVSLTGNCSGNVTITPSFDSGGAGWLSISDPVTISSGDTATFTVTIASSALASGSYGSTISLTASGSISGGAGSVGVSLMVQ